MPDRRFDDSLFRSPGRWFRGNLHTHTTSSDGTGSRHEVAEWYAAQGYDFLSITDHNKWDNGGNHGSLLLIPGIEYTDAHILAWDLPGSSGRENPPKLPDGVPIQQAIDTLSRPNLVLGLGHPYWTGVRSDQIFPVRGLGVMEIYNHVCQADNGKGYSTVHWDDLLAQGIRLWGIAVDDTHHIGKDFKGLPEGAGGWIVVKAKELSVAAVLEALVAGRFYASMGPVIEDIRWDGKEFTVRCSPATEVRFICAAHRGTVIRAPSRQTLTLATYVPPDDAVYMRVECVDDKCRIAWSNPFFPIS